MDREVSHVTTSLAELDRLLGQEGGADRVLLMQQLDNIKEQLVGGLLTAPHRHMSKVGLKSKGAEALAEEVRIAEVCKARTEHLREGCRYSDPTSSFHL